MTTFSPTTTDVRGYIILQSAPHESTRTILSFGRTPFCTYEETVSYACNLRAWFPDRRYTVLALVTPDAV